MMYKADDPRNWLEMFRQECLKKNSPTEIADRFICLVGPSPIDKPYSTVEQVCFLKYGVQVGWFNQQVYTVLKKTNRMDDVRIGLTNDMGTKTKDPALGEIALKEYSYKLCREFLIDEPASNWVG